MPATATGRGAQVVLDADAQAAARGAVASTMQGNLDAMTAIAALRDLALDDVVVAPYGASEQFDVLEYYRPTDADHTAAMQRVAAVIASRGGGVMYFPSGINVRVSATTFLPSNTVVLAYGATFTAGATWNNPAFVAGPTGILIGNTVFANVNWNAASITDHDIKILGGTFQNGPSTGSGRKGVYQFAYVRGVETAFTTVFGGGGCFAHPGCDSVSVHDNRCILVGNTAADFWNGFSNASVVNNHFSADAAGTIGPLIQFTGANSDNTQGNSVKATCIGNRVYGAGPSTFAIGITETGGVLSTMSDVVIADNIVDMAGYPGAGGIGGYGGGSNWVITGNTISNILDYNCLTIFPNGYGNPVKMNVAGNRIINCTRTSGGATLLNVTADDSTVVDNDIIGSTCTTPLTVAGANCVVRTGRMDAGSGGVRTAVSGTAATLQDYNITSGQLEHSRALQSTVGFKIGTGSLLATYTEHGTWTPVLSFGGSSTGITYSTQTGTYERIGKMVFVTCGIILTSKGVQTGNAQIAGAPFSTTNLVPRFLVAQATNMNTITDDPLIRMSSSTFTLVTSTLTGGTNLTDANFANNTNLFFSGMYVTA